MRILTCPNAEYRTPQLMIDQIETESSKRKAEIVSSEWLVWTALNFGQSTSAASRLAGLQASPERLRDLLQTASDTPLSLTSESCSSELPWDMFLTKPYTGSHVIALPQHQLQCYVWWAQVMHVLSHCVSLVWMPRPGYCIAIQPGRC